MLDTIVRYLHDARIPFRLASYPSAEHLPMAAQPIPKHAVLVDTELVVVAGKLMLACTAADGNLDLAALGNELGAPAIFATKEDLPSSLKELEGAPAPLGQLYGLPIVIDEAIARYGAVVFQPGGESDYFEVPYDDFARQEQPKIASFSRGGELPS